MSRCIDCDLEHLDRTARRCTRCGGELVASELVRPLTDLAGALGIRRFVDDWLNGEGLLFPLAGDEDAARAIELFHAALQGFAHKAAALRARWLKPSLDPARLARAWALVGGVEDPRAA